MAFQGPKNASSLVAAGTGVAWVEPLDMLTSDDSRARCTTTNANPITKFITATGFNFFIPSGGTVTGILFEVERNEGGIFTIGTFINDLSIKVSGVSGTSDDKASATPWPFTTDAIASYGGANDLWGLAPTPADINASTFGMVFAFQGNQGTAGAVWSAQARVDHIKLTVYYTENTTFFHQVRVGTIQTLTAGPNDGGTFATSGGAGIAWSNPSNAQTSDNSRATATMSDGTETTTEFLQATNFGFAIPTAASILGILLEIERSVSTVTIDANITDSSVLLAGGPGTSDEKATATQWPTVDAYVSYGSATDLWGEAWTPADINSSSFGALIQAKLNQGLASSPYSGQARIDHIRITVYYRT